jgi:hypothetical protein
VPSSNDLQRFIGRAPESLNLRETRTLSGHWVAVEVYTPATCPLRRIKALGDSVADCFRQLTSLGLDPREYEVFAIQ